MANKLDRIVINLNLEYHNALSDLKWGLIIFKLLSSSQTPLIIPHALGKASESASNSGHDTLLFEFNEYFGEQDSVNAHIEQISKKDQRSQLQIIKHFSVHDSPELVCFVVENAPLVTAHEFELYDLWATIIQSRNQEFIRLALKTPKLKTKLDTITETQFQNLLAQCSVEQIQLLNDFYPKDVSESKTMAKRAFERGTPALQHYYSALNHQVAISYLYLKDYYLGTAKESDLQITQLALDQGQRLHNVAINEEEANQVGLDIFQNLLQRQRANNERDSIRLKTFLEYEPWITDLAIDKATHIAKSLIKTRQVEGFQILIQMTTPAHWINQKMIEQLVEEGLPKFVEICINLEGPKKLLAESLKPLKAAVRIVRDSEKTNSIKTNQLSATSHILKIYVQEFELSNFETTSTKEASDSHTQYPREEESVAAEQWRILLRIALNYKVETNMKKYCNPNLIKAIVQEIPTTNGSSKKVLKPKHIQEFQRYICPENPAKNDILMQLQQISVS